MSWDARRVLVARHTGFKGAWLAPSLASVGAEVTGVSDGVPTERSLHVLAGVGSDARTRQAWLRALTLAQIQARE
jgi:hypothetical protein